MERKRGKSTENYSILSPQNAPIPEKLHGRVRGADAVWRVLPGVGVGQISDVCFVDENRAWMAVGDSLLKTADGGKTWHSITLPRPDNAAGVQRVQLLTRANGSCFGWAVSRNGRIYHTKDGLTWQRQKAPLENVKDGVTCLDVLDERHAWISGYGLTWRTTDGGKTWRHVHPAAEKTAGASFKDEEQHRFIHFRDKDNGTALVAGGYQGVLKRTTSDGGKSWKVEKVAVPDKTPSIWRVIRSGRSVHVYTMGGSLIYKHGELPIDEIDVKQLLARETLPGGYPITRNFEHQYHVVSKDIVAASEQMQGGYLTSLYITNNGGKSWSRSYLGSQLWSIDFTDQNSGWAVGSGGRVSRTSDGGDTWEHRFLPTEADFTSVFFLNEKIGWLGGGDATHGIPFGKTASRGCVWRTVDGGKTWQRTALIQNGRPGEHHIPETIDGLAFKDAKQGWAVTHGISKERVKGYDLYGRILHTTDGGKSWTPVYGPIDGASYRTIRLRGDHLCAAGYVGILTSSDGKEWKQSKGTRGLQAVAFADAQNVVAVGIEGYSHSGDGGSHWSHLKAVKLRGDCLCPIDFGSPMVGWMGSWDDKLYNGLSVTSDGGKTWQPSKIDWPPFVDPWMRYHWGWSDISAVDSHHAWAIGTCNGITLILRLKAGKGRVDR